MTMTLQDCRKKLATAAMLSTALAGGGMLIGPAAAPAAPIDSSCPPGTTKLAQETPIFHRAEKVAANHETDKMTRVGKLPAGTCVKDTGDVDGGTWTREGDNYVKDMQLNGVPARVVELNQLSFREAVVPLPKQDARKRDSISDYSDDYYQYDKGC
jgi:hypothetical protein